MTNDDVQAALAARKVKLLRDGAACRVGLVHARTMVVHGLRADSVLHSAVEHAVGFAGARLQAMLAPSGDRFSALMPLAVAAISYLSRKKMLKPALGAGLVVATVVALAGRNRS
jgi:hypothetical protein